jgi:glycosyltransferase involved in cell wall biosynthesis
MYNAKVKLALITPVKDEIENLPELIATVSAQTIPVALWIIIDDNSNDGSSAFLDNVVKTSKEGNTIKVVHATHLSQEYRLGSKYSQVIAYGFQIFNSYEKETGIRFDYIGILDADCFVEKEYYQKILLRFELLPKLGIASGVIYYRMGNGESVYDKMPLRWARGAVRVWRMECFKQCGYMVGYSADAISSALAWTKGWRSQSFKEIRAESREMGARFNYSYYGETAFYRHNPHYYIFLKFLLLTIRHGYRSAKEYYDGYLSAQRRKDRIDLPPAVVSYFHSILFRNITENWIVIRNYAKLRKHGIE